MERPVKVACVQVEPVVLDREATLDRLEKVAAEAAKAGAELVVFPETFVPVYPPSAWAKAFADRAAAGPKETVARPDLRRLDRRRRRRMAANARPHRAREPRVRRRTGALPARVGVPGGLPARRRDRGSRHDRPRRQRDPRPGRLVPRWAAVRRGGDSLRGARPGAAACGAAALRTGRPLQPAGRAPAHSSRGRCDDEYTSFRAIFPSLSGKTSTPSHSFEPVEAVHSQTAKSSPARSDLVVKRSVGLLRKIPAMCSRTDAAPSARSSAV